MKFFNRIKSAFYALTHDTTTISLLDERFWTQYGTVGSDIFHLSKNVV